MENRRVNHYLRDHYTGLFLSIDGSWVHRTKAHDFKNLADIVRAGFRLKGDLEAVITIGEDGSGDDKDIVIPFPARKVNRVA